MKRSNLEQVIRLADELKELSLNLIKATDDSKYTAGNSKLYGHHAAAVKRRSMDLTRALTQLRQDNNGYTE